MNLTVFSVWITQRNYSEQISEAEGKKIGSTSCTSTLPIFAYLSLSLSIVGVTGLLAPGALDGLAVHVRVVHRHDRVRRALLRGESVENIWRI